MLCPQSGTETTATPGRLQLFGPGERPVLRRHEVRARDLQLQQQLPHGGRGACGEVDRGAVQGGAAGQPHGRPPVRADPVADLGPAAGEELLLGVGGDLAAAGGGDRGRRVQVGVHQHQAGDEPGVPGGQHDGHRAAHAVGDDLGAVGTARAGGVERLREGVRVRLQGVRELLGPVAVPVPQQVDQQRTPARQQRVRGARREVGGRGRAQPVQVHAGGLRPGQFGPADPVASGCHSGTAHDGRPPWSRAVESRKDQR